MSGTLRLKGSTSGYSELKAPAVAGDQTFILPAVGGDLLTTDNPAPYLTLESGVVTAPSLRFEGDLDTGLYTPAANKIGIVTNANERVSIDSNGNVGIGTSNPTGKLEIAGNNSSQVIQYGDGTTAGYFISKTDVNRGTADAGLHVHDFRWNGTSVAKIKALTGDDTVNKDNGYLTFDTNNGAGVTERMRIASDGNVGIGKASPDYLLDVNTNHVRFGNSSGVGLLQLGASSTASNNFHLGATGSTVRLWNGDIGTGTELLRIESNGNIGIGTSSPEALLDVTGGNLLVQNSVGNTIRLRTTVDNGNDSTFVFQKARGGSGTIADVINGDDLGTISWNGYYGGSYQTNSTIRGEAIIGASYGDRLLYDSDTHILRTNNTSRLAIISDGKVGIGTSSPTELLEAVATNPRLCIRDTQTSITTASATLRLAESGAGDTLDNYWDVVADNTAGNFGFSVKESGVSRFAIQAGNGNVGIGTTSPSVELDVAGEIRASSGILFGTDTAAANSLDDYEEGTWTPAFTNGTFTYTNQTGNYTKIGDMVYISGAISWSAKSGTGNLATTLPFTSAGSVNTHRYPLAIGYVNGVDNGGERQLIGTNSGNRNGVGFYLLRDNNSPTNTTVTNANAAGEIQFSVVLKVA